MTIASNSEGLMARLRARAAGLSPSSPELKKAFGAIGLMVTARARMNIRRKGIIDTGRLLNSMRFEMFSEGDVAGIRAGSFGVPYAAMHEFGGKFTERQRRAMFWNLGRRGGPKRPSKGVVRGGHFRARPYLRPAVAESRAFILAALRSVMGES